MKKTNPHELIEKYLDGSATPEENIQIEASLNKHMAHGEDMRMPEEIELAKQRSKEVVLKAINQSGETKWRRNLLPYAAAALMIFGLFLWKIKDWTATSVIEQTESRVVVNPQNILPGGDQATLVLENGQTLLLDETQQGVVVQGEDILYKDGTQISGTTNGHTPSFATLATPKGGTYQITLPDGSQVWLNAASSLRYPLRFADDERIVELKGEAYFEVKSHQAKGLKIPFKVKTRGQVVEVLGTEFNVLAYEEEDEIQTTLVEGRVNVVPNSGDKVLLLPGQQARNRRDNVAVSKVDLEQFTAWKKGYFYFDRLSPQIVFAQLSRWYDVDVVYRGEVPKMRIFGMVDRKKPLSSVLGALEKSGLSFDMQESMGRIKLVVLGEK